MNESFLKGGVLLFTKEAIIRTCTASGLNEVMSGLIGGFGGGVAQVTAVTGDKSVSHWQRTQSTFRSQEIGGFYHGGTALIFRILCASKHKLMLPRACHPSCRPSSSS